MDWKTMVSNTRKCVPERKRSSAYVLERKELGKRDGFRVKHKHTRMSGSSYRSSLINVSIEEQNLAGIPFAILERRVGKRLGKLEIEGCQILPNGTEVRVVWQVQGSDELGLPTEQDLDIFVALGVLTFRSNFEKTITFSGREIARILGIASVHGKFYQRLKLAMDRFISLRFRAITSTDRQHEVKWLNVFQEASFAFDRSSGRCTGSVTWTDKLIQSMDAGFFRALDARRYMVLDGITAKHLYRYLALAFAKTDLIVIDARKLATQHLGIVNVPRYLSRLMQTLEPAFEQLMRVQVLASYHVVSSEEWTLALHRHPAYLSENKLLLTSTEWCPELKRNHCERLLKEAGLTAKAATEVTAAANLREQFYALERGARLIEALKSEQVLPHVAVSMVRRALDEDPVAGSGRDVLDWCEIAIEICRHKRTSGQTFRNAAGFIMKIVKDGASRARFVDNNTLAAFQQQFRNRELAVLRQDEEAQQRTQILEYETFRREIAQTIFSEMTTDRQSMLRKEKTAILQQQGRFDRMPTEMREREIDHLILHDLACGEAPPFEKWLLRKRAQQAVLPFESEASTPDAISSVS